jgi:hypothetical protein
VKLRRARPRKVTLVFSINNIAATTLGETGAAGLAAVFASQLMPAPIPAKIGILDRRGAPMTGFAIS